ncbi:MAG: hypothetical protein AAGA56_13075, partial [Myxococcota bacterium]
AREPLRPPHVGAFDRERNIQDHGVIDGLIEDVAPHYLAVLAPYKVGATAGDPAQPMTVTPLTTESDSTAFLVGGVDGREMVWVRQPGASSTLAVSDELELTSDAALTIVGLPVEGQEPTFAFIARGSEASLNAQPLVSATAEERVKLEEWVTP